MMFDRIHHAGLAVANLDQAKKIFADALGLRPDTTRSPYPGGRQQRGGDPTDILDIPIGDSELELNAPAGEGTGTHRFVQSRGGVGALHHVCLHTTNVAEDVAHLRASGLTQIAAPPERIASGDPWTSVAFFHPKDCQGILLEIWPTTNHRVGDEYQGDRVFTRLAHIGVVTTDLEKARQFWCNTIGFRVDPYTSPINKGGRHVDLDNVNVLDIPVGESGITCVHPNDTSSGTARFLEKYGARAGGTMHHVALATKDVRAAADRLQSHGLKLIGKPDNDYAWVHPKSAAGVLIEIVRDEA
jgi:methylmalonyl-CoA epimerase